jgi:hypothetical protein
MAENGLWVLGAPKGIRAANQQFSPDGDSPADVGNSACVTGNTGEFIHDDQVDNGETILTSPGMDLASRYIRPMLTFDYWWYNVWSNNPPDDSLKVELYGNFQTRTLMLLATDTNNVQQWAHSDTFDLRRHGNISNNMFLIFTASDRSGTPNVVEAGIDNIRIFEGSSDSIFITKDELSRMRVYPNPSADFVTVDYKVDASYSELRLEVSNVWGQIVQRLNLTSPIGSVELNLQNLAPAPYFVYLRVDGEISKATKLIKVVYGE